MGKPTRELEADALRQDVSDPDLHAIAHELSFRRRPRAVQLAQKIKNLIVKSAGTGSVALEPASEATQDPAGAAHGVRARVIERQELEVVALARTRLGTLTVVLLPPSTMNRNDDLFLLDHFSSGYLIRPNLEHTLAALLRADSGDALGVILFEALREIARLESARRARTLQSEAERRIAADAFARAERFGDEGLVLLLEI
jgi:hypothetical protein